MYKIMNQNIQNMKSTVSFTEKEGKICTHKKDKYIHQ